MDRRKFLTGVGSTAIGGSALLGSGAFSRVESQRAVTIAVAEDPDAYLGLDECNTLHGDNYVSLDEKGHLVVDISENPNGGEGVNSNSRTYFDNVFEICNQGKESVCVWIYRSENWPEVEEGEYAGEPRVDFYLGDDEQESILGTENAVELAVGECSCIGIRTSTHGINANDEEPLLDALDDEILLVADVECPDPDIPSEEPEPSIETWTEVGDRDEAGGPVILMGLDSELVPGGSSHGPPEEHAAMVESLFDSVMNGGEGILVLGDGSNIRDYWEGDVGDAPNVDQDVTFVGGEQNIRDVDFDGYAMIGVASSTNQIPNGLTSNENQSVIDRSDDIAAFVNEGGALLGKTQDNFGADSWAYVDPFGDFETGSANNSNVYVTEDGTDLGLTQDGMDGWCCYHEVFLSYPDFFDVLLKRDNENGDANAIGGEQVVIERAVSMTITGWDRIEVGQPEQYDVEVENQNEEDSVEGSFDIEVVSGSGAVSDSLPASVELDPEESMSLADALEVTCNAPGPIEIEVTFDSVNDGSRLIDVTMEIECFE